MADFVTQPVQINSPNPGEVLKNVKELKIADGKVRIKDGAIIISDETGTDRVIIGRLEDGF